MRTFVNIWYLYVLCIYRYVSSGSVAIRQDRTLVVYPGHWLGGQLLADTWYSKRELWSGLARHSRLRGRGGFAQLVPRRRAREPTQLMGVVRTASAMMASVTTSGRFRRSPLMGAHGGKPTLSAWGGAPTTKYDHSERLYALSLSTSCACAFMFVSCPPRRSTSGCKGVK